MDRLTAETRSTEQLMRDLTVCASDQISTAAAHHLSAGGSRVRCRLALDAGCKLGLNLHTRRRIAAACELLHNASLIHDDMQDGDSARRGTKSVWACYGKDVALLTGDLFISAAYASLSEVATNHCSVLIAKMHEATSRAIRGQDLDLSAAENAPLTISSYQAIAIGKSGSLLSLPLEMSLLTAGHEGAIEVARSAANAFAIAYQMSDDIKDQAVDKAAGRPNIVNMLCALKGVLQKPAVEEASDLACEHLSQSLELASKLPSGAGDLLIEYTLIMLDALKTRAAA